MDVVSNFIGAKGVKYLTRAEWPALQELNVGISHSTKDTTTLELRGLYIFHGLVGRASPSFG